MKTKSKLKAKKESVKANLAAKKAKIKGRFKSAALVALLSASAALFGGCALERADPAARSNRAIYTLTVTAHGDNSTATAYIADGLMATADGEGAITQPSTLTTEQSPDVTVPGDALTAGIQAVGQVVGKGIDAYSASKSGDCKTGDCADGKCTDGKCSD